MFRPAPRPAIGTRPLTSRDWGFKYLIRHCEEHSDEAVSVGLSGHEIASPRLAMTPHGWERALMEIGMFHEFPSMPGRSETEMFDEAHGANRCGRTLGPRRDVARRNPFRAGAHLLASPLAIASAIAGRTERMKIGIAVQVLPLCHPLRLAEEAATVDQISQGRLIFGVGRSGVVSTYDAYGVPYDESRDRFAEILDIVKQAWSAAAVFVLRQVPQLRQRRLRAASL